MSCPLALIRADASTRIGTGHVMRCLVLAGALQGMGWRVTFVTRELEGNLNARIESEGFEVINLKAPDEEGLTAIIGQEAPELLIIDHYGIGRQTEQAVREATGIKLVVIDDTFEPHACDALINQNIYANAEAYKGLVPKTCTLFCGAAYALLRPEFRSLPEPSQSRNEIPTLLITLGGSDPHNQTLRILEALENVSGLLKTMVVVGAANPHADTLQQYIQNFRHHHELLRGVSHMGALMAQADAAITAGGSTTIETLVMRLPSIVVGIAENQRLILEALEAKGLARVVRADDNAFSSRLAEALKTVLEAPEGMLAAMEELAIGKGWGALCGYLGMTLEPVSAEDSDKLFLLANDPAVRSASFHSGAISKEEHVRWFKGVLEDKNRRLYCYQTGDTFAGQFRLDREGDQAEVSFSIAPEVRGKGWAAGMLLLGCEKAVTLGISRLVARIKRDNVASLKSFSGAGFKTIEEGEIITMEKNL